MSVCRAGKSRHRLVPEPDAIVRLTDRDRSLIRTVALHGAASRSQLATIGQFTSISRANRRLRALFDGNYLRRTYVASGPFSPEAVYILGPRGVPIAVEETNLDPIELARQSRRRPERMFLEHLLGVLSIRLELYQAPNSITVKEFASEPECRHEYVVKLGHKSYKRLIKPDGYFLVDADGLLRPYFLEFDRGHVSLRQMKWVFERYALYFTEGAFGSAYALGLPFEVLVVTTAGKRRIAHLEALVKGTIPIVRFAAVSDIQSFGLFGSVWRHKGNQGPERLIWRQT